MLDGWPAGGAADFSKVLESSQANSVASFQILIKGASNKSYIQLVCMTERTGRMPACACVLFCVSLTPAWTAEHREVGRTVLCCGCTTLIHCEM